METILKKVPEGFTEHDDDVMSNFDHSINITVADQLKTKPVWASYTGWNFCGKVWWEENQWHCEVRQYKEHVATVSADTLEGIMSEICAEYGSE